MRINASMTKEELELQLEKSIEICDRLVKEMYAEREKKQEFLDKNGWCDFDLEKILTECVELTKEDVKILIGNAENEKR